MPKGQKNKGQKSAAKNVKDKTEEVVEETANTSEDSQVEEAPAEEAPAEEAPAGEVPAEEAPAGEKKVEVKNETPKEKEVPVKVKARYYLGQQVMDISDRIVNGRTYKEVRVISGETFLLTHDEYDTGVYDE